MTISNLLRGGRIRLTALNASDLPTLVHWFEDAEFMRLYDARPARPRSEAELTRWLEDLQKAKDDLAFAVRPLDGQNLIGYVELDGILWPHGVCGFSIGIGEQSNWGQGYGYEAARLALAFAFDEINLHRVTATVFGYNERSFALFE